MQEYDGYKKLLKVSEEGIDLACLQQPVLYQEVAEKTIECRTIYESAKVDMDRLEAQVKQAIRGSGEKNTEGSIAEKVLLTTECQEAKKRLASLRREYGLYQELSESYKQRLAILKLHVRVAETSINQIQDSTIGTQEQKIKMTATANKSRCLPRRRRTHE